MKLFLIAAALVLIAVQEPEVYPPGHVCVRAEQVRGPADHPCECQRKCITSENEEGKETISVQEDPQCKQYCHKEHCSCPMIGCE